MNQLIRVFAEYTAAVKTLLLAVLPSTVNRGIARPEEDKRVVWVGNRTVCFIKGRKKYPEESLQQRVWLPEGLEFVSSS